MKKKAASEMLLSLLLIGMLTLAFNIQTVKAESTDRKVGVNVGYWIQYGISVTWESDDPDATIPQYILNSQQLVFFSNLVQSVSGTNITFDRIMHFQNGTEKSDTYWIDVDTGKGTSYLYFISANLNAGDTIYNAPGQGRIDETITRTYLGETVEVNHSNDTTSNGYFMYVDIYWNRATGVLYEYYMNHTTYTTKGEETYATQETQWIYPIGVSSAPRTWTVDVDPGTLNLRSKDRWITTYIELPEDYNVGDIDRTTVLLNDTIPVDIFWVDKPLESVIGDYDEDGIPDLMVKFDRVEVIEFILNADTLPNNKFIYVTLALTGQLTDETPFEGNDTIKIVLLYKHTMHLH